ncbi:urea amidolyase associated protein UAAP1 [Microbulbifer thermotolerans]|uniref:Urea carboxylase n=1 Tax=Microbulbifer thermotolerans TaxID=252514 RepID=A0A143HMB3_MICTH|nr:urea amidolyase associated protein UAAP1 [Microbulbifer thermotolerans]AMX02823.1 urea carboxylase [Microbulbifer thermotolerans]MCX2782654.1 urea carboxylase-associated family protein [Microbulbifer thermotolerans]MCX2794666.1 urea carboxylase-associated family protein [Microbulbifer thermotolerans]MCX2801494.1 urea carboxylase-associated family protein [Microbulbifer thermotolerans]MCX2831755.1 urea carboxylase-associated family protein [Microbulbifer thermotolerans]
MKSIEYTTEIPAGGHWSLRMRKGTLMRLTDLEGGANVGMLFYNPENLLERYNAPDTLKCQHTFKLTRGNCLYSDMGRIFASIVEDSLGWHETVCGNIRADQVTGRWGVRDYQHDRNNWHQNGHDAFLVELAKYGLGCADLAANINWFSKVAADAEGRMQLVEGHSQPGSHLTLRFEMDTLVVLHNCPHPLCQEPTYPQRPVRIDLGEADPVSDDDYCLNFRPENRRGFQNNALYHLGK